MPWSMYGAFVFTVALMCVTLYFLLGGLPLLVLQHDVPMDAKFVGAFFGAYYAAAFWAGCGAALSYALWGHPLLATGAAGIAVAARLLRRHVLPVMQELGRQIEQRQAGAVRRFRQIHAVALLVNVVLLAVLVWGTLRLSATV